MVRRPKQNQDTAPRFVEASLLTPFVTFTPQLCAMVFEKFGITPRPWQATAIDMLIRGFNVLIKAGTGSGKSLIFQALALGHPKTVKPIVLVISPLLSLMDNQVFFRF
jgi:superfamily II DNA helicase RecQ